MKFIFALFTLFFYSENLYSQTLRFIHISDTHIGSPNGSAEEDLRRTVEAINRMNDVMFVVITGDITELGTDAELQLAKQLLSNLKVRWYIIPGNHDTGWSESGGEGFKKVFGYDKFVFDSEGIRFIGLPSGPYVRMSDGHIPRSSLIWFDSVLASTAKEHPVIFLNHYPIDPGLDNWYEITDRLGELKTLAILCGHGHANRQLNFDGIPGFMGRSNLRARALVGGFNLVDIRNDSIFYTERRPGEDYAVNWVSAKLKKTKGLSINSKRPDKTINERYPFVRASWTYSSNANVIVTPVVHGELVIFGNQAGEVEALSIKTGRKVWSMKTGGAIYSSPAITGNNVILASTDGNVYCLRVSDGKQVWVHTMGGAVLGSPVIEDGRVYIGGASGSFTGLSHNFRALNKETGKLLWVFTNMNGPVVSTPVINGDKVIFGAWDTHLYALNKNTGELLWKWSNGSTVRNYSPASCIPVISGSTVFIVAPDRYITAIDIESGKALWRNNDATVRESIGISTDRKWIYAKTMQDTIVAYRASREKQAAAWKMHCGFGYEHVPSMLIEKNGAVFFGTKNGVVYSIDPVEQKIRWAHKIDNSMVNTVRVVGKDKLVVATMDGKVVLMEMKR